MRAVFVSYRRDDTEGQAGRLYDDLVRRFGVKAVFMDVVGIEPGSDFRTAIDQNVASCSVLLALMGPGWIDARDETGRRRLDNPTDSVRLETSSALKRDIAVIPVLVRGAKMPRAEQLPNDLQQLAYRNAVELTHVLWDSDVQLLVKVLERHLCDAPRRRAEFWRTLLAVVAAGAITTGYASYEYRKASRERARQVAAETAGRQLADQKAAAERESIQKAAADSEARQKEAVDRKPPKRKPQPTPPQASIPNFSGTWAPIEETFNGEEKPVAHAKRSITQRGSVVKIGSREWQISKGRVTYKRFAVQDNQYPFGRTVEKEAAAALVETHTWRLDGSILVFETTFNYKVPYYGHQIGTDLRIMRYRRVSP